MQKVGSLVGIFAHPDDEAFGPSGTLAKYAKKKNVYIICVTDGNDKTNGTPKLSQLRERELRESAKILGIKKVYFLGFKDGSLSNNLYHKVADRIEVILRRLKPDTLITYEPRGISGHIDHVAVSMISSYLFERLNFVRRTLYYCILQRQRKGVGKYFIYFPDGYKKTEVDLEVDVKDTWVQKLAAMQAHKTQFKDVERILKILKKVPKKEYFLVIKK